MTSTQWAPKQKGFTIVELLIVIVVIAILAAITIVAYNGITQRANNTATISAVDQTVKAIQAYIASTGDYPYKGGSMACVTTTSGCIRDTGVVDSAIATFDTNMATIATLPRSVPVSGTNGNGIMYSYQSGRTINGESQPAILLYWLRGSAQKCGLSPILSAWGTPDGAITSTTGYTASSPAGKTMCFVSIPGPGSA